MDHPHFVARIRMRDTTEGGRRTPAYLANYRPDVRDPAGGPVYFGVHFFHDPGELGPGQTRDLTVTVRSTPAEFMKRVSVGSKLVFCEGSRPIADGEIIEILARPTP